jgi:glycosyltransferase involved in cell wall biosynthesis
LEINKLRDHVLTSYGLSREFEKSLSGLLQPDSVRLSLAELRQLPLMQMLKRLRSVRAKHLYLPTEDDSSRALLPVMTLIASFTRAKEIVLVDQGLRRERISRARACLLALRMMTATVSGLTALRRSAKDVRALLAVPRMNIDRPAGRKGLFLNGNLWFGVKAGGSVGHISGVINGLLEEGYSVDFASAGGRLMTSESATYVQLQAPEHFGVPWEYNYYRFNYDVVDQLTRHYGDRPFDFIYQRLSIANFSGVLLSRKLKVPLIVEYNGSEAWVARNWGRPLREQALAEDAEAVCLKHAELVVTISDVLRDELLERGVPAERIVTYPNCIDPAIFDPSRFGEDEVRALRQDYGIAPDAKVVTFVGTFGQWHGAEVLARAIRQLCDQAPEWVEARKVHFLFVGDGLKMPAVQRELGRHASGPHVTLAGLVPQGRAPLHLAASDILVSPHVPNADGSRFFGSPTKLFEYLAMGRPVLASDLDQIGEILAGSPSVAQQRETGAGKPDTGVALMAEPGNAADLADGIRMLVDDPAWAAGLGRRARELALSRYTWRHHVHAIIAQARKENILA